MTDVCFGIIRSQDITMGYKNIERTDQIDGRETDDLAYVYDVSLRDIHIHSSEMKII